MGNLPARIPQLLTQSLSQRDLERHRAEIGVFTEGTLHNYWVSTPDMAVKAVTLGQWMDALENYPINEVAQAMSKWVATETRKPKPADIRKLIVDARKSSQPPREFMTTNERSLMEQRQASDNRETYDSNAIIAELGMRKKVTQ